jgi:CHASE2 domain-containing sensor protein
VKGFQNFDYRKYPRKKKHHFYLNILIGIGVLFALTALEKTSWGENSFNTLFDIFLNFESSDAKNPFTTGNQSENKTGFPTIDKSNLLFIDIDHATYLDWEEPIYTPRDKIANILRTLTMANVKAIVLDILFEEPDYKNPEKDAKLRDSLDAILTDKSLTTKIIFPVRIKSDGKIKKNIFNALLADQALLDIQHRRFFTAAPNLSLSSSDNLARYWNLYDLYLTEQGEKEILWGVPILAAIVAHGDLSKLDVTAKKIIGKEMDGDLEGEIGALNLDNGKTVTLSLDNTDRYLQRIRFNLIPENSLQRNPGVNTKEIFPGNLTDITIGYTELEKYRQSAFLKDKVVFVGNSSPDTGDIFKTPVGKMPGMYILANAYNSIAFRGQPRAASAWLIWTFEILVVIVAAYAFLFFSPFLAQIIISLGILIIAGYFSYQYFVETGYFMNFIFALVAMSIHKTIGNIEKLFSKKESIKHE